MDIRVKGTFCVNFNIKFNGELEVGFMPQLTEGVMNQVMDNIARLPEEEQFLLSTSIENLLNGSHWGFMTKELVKVYRNPEQFNNDLTHVYDVGTNLGKKQYLVQAKDPKTALKVLQKAAPMLVDKKFVDDYLTRLQETRKAFTNFLQSNAKKGFKGYIGAYSINSTNTMTYKGQRNKAFQLSVEDLLSIGSSILGNNISVYVKGQPKLVKDIFSEYNNLDEFLQDLEVSEGSTSVVLPIIFKY